MNEQAQTDGSERRHRRYFYGRIVPGIYMLVVGVIFLLNNFGILQGQAWGKLWPIFIIIPAIFMIFRPRRCDCGQAH